MYNETGIQKTMLISKEHDTRLKAYCKSRSISASQLFRLMIDELSVSEWDVSLKDNIQTTAMKVNHFVTPNKIIIKETVNDTQGNIIQRWFQRREVHASYPHSRHA